MKVTMVNGKIGIEKVSKLDRSKEQKLSFVVPEDTNCNGIVRYSFEESKFPVGTKVLFGSQREPVTIDGKEIHIMLESNVIAVINEETTNEEIKN